METPRTCKRKVLRETGRRDDGYIQRDDGNNQAIPTGGKDREAAEPPRTIQSRDAGAQPRQHERPNVKPQLGREERHRIHAHSGHNGEKERRKRTTDSCVGFLVAKEQVERDESRRRRAAL